MSEPDTAKDQPRGWSRVRYQGALELRVRTWFARGDSPLGRALRLALLVGPFILAAVFSIPLCPSAALLRIPCPGCGMSRAATALATGDFAGALTLNPLSPVVVPLTILAVGYAAVSYVATGRTRFRAWVDHVAIVLCSGLIIVWIARFFGAFGGPVDV